MNHIPENTDFYTGDCTEEAKHCPVIAYLRDDLKHLFQREKAIRDRIEASNPGILAELNGCERDFARWRIAWNSAVRTYHAERNSQPVKRGRGRPPKGD